MFEFKNIYDSYKECRKNKRNTINALKFEFNLIDNIVTLESELKSRRYNPTTSLCFLTTSPKLREVFAADFRDRVVHHILTPKLENFYEPKFIFDVYNNRKNKGIHSGMKRALHFSRGVRDGYYLQLDISGFFYNLNKNILFQIIYNDFIKTDIKFKDEILWLVHKIIYHNPTKDYYFQGNINQFKQLPSHKTLFKLPPEKGLAIGNITSQFFANIYLYRFDNWVKRFLKVKRYIRYVDDMVIFDNDKNKLLDIKLKIENYLKTNLEVSLRKDTKIKKVKQGLDFLGYVIRPDYILVRKRVINNFKYKKARFLDKYEKFQGSIKLKDEIDKFLAVKSSFKSHCKHANSYKLLNKVGKENDEKYINFILNDWNS
jgi:hypothetical protein